jgi:hypothetical protein
VANSLYISLSSSAAVQPNFWVDPKIGITYTVAAQTPQYRLNSINSLENTPIPLHTVENRTEVLGNMAALKPEADGNQDHGRSVARAAAGRGLWRSLWERRRVYDERVGSAQER